MSKVDVLCSILQKIEQKQLSYMLMMYFLVLTDYHFMA